MNKAMKLQEIRAQIKELKKQEELLTAEFKEMGEGAHQQDGFVVCVKSTERKTLDAKRLEALLGNLDEYKKTTKVVTVRVQVAAAAAS